MNLRNDEVKNFVHCPNNDCKEPILGNWKTIDTNNKNEKGLPLYKCPHCGTEFTADDVKVNAVRVNPNSDYVAVYNTQLNDLVFLQTSQDIFSDGEDYYIHVPLIIIMNEHNKLFCLEVKDKVSVYTENDIKKMIFHSISNTKRK